MIVSGDAALREFRKDLTGRRILEMLTENVQCLRIDLPVGVGKSVLLDKIVEEVVQGGDFDLVVILVPTRRILEERAFIRNSPDGIRVINLRPRPIADCGPERNARWSPLEKQGMSLLGRNMICTECDRENACFWPRQYSKENLCGASVIFGTQAHLVRSADFIDQLQLLTEAPRVLVLFDEGNFLVSPFRRRLRREHLVRFQVAVRETCRRHRRWKSTKRLHDYIEILLTADTKDLRQTDWRIPSLRPMQAVILQGVGWGLFGADFWYLGTEVSAFGSSSLESRARLANGDLRYAAQPQIGQAFVFFSGTTSQSLAEYRLGVKFHSPFAGIVFKHPQTSWINIASRLGMKQYLPHNAAQIFDFFSELLTRRLTEGKRVVLLVKKKFVPLCVTEVQRRLDVAGFGKYRVVPSNIADCGDLLQIPTIHYGTLGVNDFQEFDAVYCLTGFYVNERVVNSVLQDVMAADFSLPIEIKTVGQPLRRRAGVKRLEDRCYDIHQLAQLVLDEQEIGVAIQAVGRVRPFTKPREVILFQCGQVPGVTYDQEFSSLAAARLYFGISTRRQQKKQEAMDAVRKCRAEGQTQKQTAVSLSLSVRTVKRYWTQGDTKPI